MVNLNAGSYSVQKKNLIPITILTIIFLYLCIELYLNTIAVVQQQNLLPLWDPATHSLYGWELYFYLKNFNLPMFFWLSGPKVSGHLCIICIRYRSTFSSIINLKVHLSVVYFLSELSVYCQVFF